MAVYLVIYVISKVFCSSCRHGKFTSIKSLFLKHLKARRKHKRFIYGITLKHVTQY